MLKLIYTFVLLLFFNFFNFIVIICTDLLNLKFFIIEGGEFLYTENISFSRAVNSRNNFIKYWISTNTFELFKFNHVNNILLSKRHWGNHPNFILYHDVLNNIFWNLQFTSKSTNYIHDSFTIFSNSNFNEKEKIQYVSTSFRLIDANIFKPELLNYKLNNENLLKLNNHINKLFLKNNLNPNWFSKPK